MAEQRRREQRVTPRSVSLWLRIEDRATICPVLNISRLGIAIELPSDESAEHWPDFSMGSVLKATLKIDGKTLSLGLRVLRLGGSQLGCAFEFPDDGTQRTLAQTLSPHFVSRSLEEVASRALHPDVREAFFGSDFSLVFYKQKGKVRISTGGYECQIDGRDLRVLEPEATDWSSDQDEFLVASAYDFLPHEESSESQIGERILRVLESWSDRPEDCGSVIELLRERYAS